MARHQPVIIEPIIQKDIADCGIACLAMVLGVPYVLASTIAREVTKKPHSTGLGTRQMLSIARKLGYAMECIKAADVNVDEDTGILFVGFASSEHATVLFQGVLVNPADGLLYDPSTYLTSNKGRVLGMLRP